jgi:hypothetical protein
MMARDKQAALLREMLQGQAGQPEQQDQAGPLEQHGHAGQQELRYLQRYAAGLPEQQDQVAAPADLPATTGPLKTGMYTGHTRVHPDLII